MTIKWVKMNLKNGRKNLPPADRERVLVFPPLLSRREI